MAQIIVREIFWRRNSPYGTFVTNDLVTIYYDTGTGLPVVKKNAGTITSGAAIPLFFNYNGRDASYYKTEKAYDTVICDSTTRIELQRIISSFPYVEKKSFGSSPSCAVSPVVCDLQFNSLPVITNESSLGANDGAVTVTALSSNDPVEYKLNSDFIYGGGSASGTFSGLASGSYRIYARDAGNCSANILVVVNYDRVYGTLYTLEYDDREYDTTKIEIQERDYVGSSSDVSGGEPPFFIRLRGEREQDKFVPILGTEIEVVLLSETNFKYLGLFTSDPNKYRILFKKDFGAGYETLLTTKLIPNQYKEQYTDPPYLVSFLGTDGIASLSGISFLDGGGNRFTGEYRCIELIAYCLKNTGLNLSIRVAINLYAIEMDSTNSDDPLDQALVDVLTYYKNDSINCMDVIRLIIEPYGAQLVQWGNIWNITRVEEKVQQYDYREFDFNGVYVSNSSFDPIIVSQETKDTGVIWVSSPEMEMNPSYGIIKLKYNLGLRDNILVNGDFKLKSEFNIIYGIYDTSPDINGFQLIANGDDGIVLNYQITDQNVVKPYADNTNIISDKNNIAIGLDNGTGLAYLLSKDVNIIMGGNDQIKFLIRCGLPTFSQEFPYVKIRCIVKYGIYYLQGDGTWTTSASELIFFTKEYGKFVEFSVLASRPVIGASAGYDLNVVVYHAYAYHAEFTAVADLRTKVTTSLGIGHRTEWYDFSGADLFFYELENNTSAESVPNIVRPNDYNGVTNPVQWILKTQRDTGLAIPTVFYIDKIFITYLFGGTLPPEAFDADITAEENNPSILEKSVDHGSLAEIIQTSVNILPIFTLNFNTFAEIQYVDILIQNASKIYTGYFRDSLGIGFENWSRSYLSEALPLHEILLRSYASQYNKPWRRIRGSLTGREYVTPLNSIQEEFDENRIYYPVSLEIDDLNRVFAGEFLELADVVGDDEVEEIAAGFTIGFSTGFNS